ncbi:cytochrome c-type biogenesis protein [Ottowia testudinis]|uniref:Cytochrome c-type biogenesis protein n=1 Tax=Ottowia testudinis TaxID=2816950 RepID=A0A975H4U7_9BURK|nr:cytochrome c-type biogenesis protein [Ottowia testudinis]QTD47253.1 cytochrome c-type biogenesis protein CcmH [Ottowia testudinis]
MPRQVPFCVSRDFKPFWPLALAALALAAHLLIVGTALAAPDPLADRMHQLTQDLRCLVCQNESLADSHAPLAMDLKREIRTRMAQGESDAQIRDFLQQRYGDFVNYQPPFKASTLLLWAGPLLLLAGGGLLVWRTVRARGDDAAPEDDA